MISTSYKRDHKSGERTQSNKNLGYKTKAKVFLLQHIKQKRAELLFSVRGDAFFYPKESSK